MAKYIEFAGKSVFWAVDKTAGKPTGRVVDFKDPKNRVAIWISGKHRITKSYLKVDKNLVKHIQRLKEVV
jgi:hypothetical protein